MTIRFKDSSYFFLTHLHQQKPHQRDGTNNQLAKSAKLIDLGRNDPIFVFCDLFEFLGPEMRCVLDLDGNEFFIAQNKNDDGAQSPHINQTV